MRRGILHSEEESFNKMTWYFVRILSFPVSFSQFEKGISEIKLKPALFTSLGRSAQEKFVPLILSSALALL